MKNFMQGRFIPSHPEKYKGDTSSIFFRSSWEKVVFQYMDKSPFVEWWSSEETIVPYRNPLDGKVHRYFVDITACIKGQVYLIEIKPKSKTLPPKPPKRKTSKGMKRLQEDIIEFEINKAKWESASNFARKMGWKFIILTEDELRKIGFRI